MAIVNTHYGFCAKGGAAVKFTYTGEYNVRDDGVVELLTSGTIVFLEPKVIDVFMVGGGASGMAPSTSQSPKANGYGGGGGGYTRTVRRVSIAENTSIPITIGAGGEIKPTTSPYYGVGGGASGWGSYTVNGGSTFNDTKYGGPGGSGGGGGVASKSDYGSGGSDGSNGEQGSASTQGGAGQGFTTREFGEATGKLYAGGGGGGRYMVSSVPVVSMGGPGGGGSGAWSTTKLSDGSQAASAGGANTGGGGGGGVFDNTSTGTLKGASGGSGIVCFREAHELPELAGTWVLNERLYYPDNGLDELFNFTARSDGGSSKECNRWRFRVNETTPEMRFYYTSGGSNEIYRFTTNTWTTSNKYKTIIIPSGATASDEFRAWLASNATKQS